MYTFAIVALLGLATVKLVDFLCDYVHPLGQLRSLLTFIVAVGGIWALNFSMFDGWNTAVRNHDVGIVVTVEPVAGHDHHLVTHFCRDPCRCCRRVICPSDVGRGHLEEHLRHGLSV